MLQEKYGTEKSRAMSIVPDEETAAYSGPFILEVIRQPAEVAHVIDEWHTLLAQLERVTCFASPEWLLAWWHYFGSHSRLYIIVLRVPEAAGTKLVGIVPFQIDLWGHFPLRVRVIRWLGQSNGALTDTLGAFFATGYEQVGMQAALTYLSTHCDEWDMLALARTPVQYVQTLTLWARQFGSIVHVLDTVGWLSIQLSSTWESYQSTLSKNLRSNLPRYRNRLLRDGHRAAFITLTEPQALIEALPQFFVLHRQRALAEQMKHHSDYFSSADSRAFLAHIVSVLAQQHRCALMQMLIDDTVVAMQLLLLQEQSVSLYFSGFDPQWSRYSVMMLTTRASLEYVIAHGYRWVDLTAGGGSQAKRQWGNEERVVHYIALARPTLQGYSGIWGMRVWHYMQNYLLEDIQKCCKAALSLFNRKKV